jgi:hypothetical protein
MPRLLKHLRGGCRGHGLSDMNVGRQRFVSQASLSTTSMRGERNGKVLCAPIGVSFFFVLAPDVCGSHVK